MFDEVISEQKHDILGLGDIQRFVDAFYKKVQDEPSLGRVFNEIAGVSWDSHLETMYQFWNRILFGAGSYRGNPLAKHRDLQSRIEADYPQDEGLSENNFSVWVRLFESTIDELFTGLNANAAKKAAHRMRDHLVESLKKKSSSHQMNLVPDDL